MMLRAPEAEALYEGSAQKGFGFLSIDGSPFPLGSTATHEPIGISISLWGMWKPLDATGSKPVG
jgi:putative transposase